MRIILSQKIIAVFSSVLLVSLTVVSCSKPEKKSVEDQQGIFEPLVFNVDSSRLGDQIEIAGVRFFVPRDWEPISESIIEIMRTRAEEDTGYLGMRPEYAFGHKNGSVLLASRFTQDEDQRAGFAEWAQQIGDTYRKARSGQVMQEAWISIAGIEALQLYTRDESMIHFKFLIHAAEPLGIDFTVPAVVWETQVRFVESSLGSLTRIDTE